MTERQNISGSKILDYANFGLIVFLCFCAFFKDHIFILPTISWLGKFHLLLLHLPIGAFISILFLRFLNKEFLAEQQTKILIQFMVLITLLASITGLFHSLNGEYNTTKLNWHFYGAMTFAALIYLLQYVMNRPLLFNALTALSFVSLMVTGHNGGVLTHGDNFLSIDSKQDENYKDTSNTVFVKLVQPIIDEKCVSCHNDQKQKGGLILTDSTHIMAGGKNGAVIIPSNASESKLYFYALLPMKDKMHMPPDGKPQLTNTEVTILRHWINSGASFSKSILEVTPTDSLYPFVKELSVVKVEKQYLFKAAAPDVIKSINSPYVYVSSLSSQSPALQARFFVAQKFDKKSLSTLRKIKEQLIYLDLGGMPIKDEDLSAINAFPNLEKLVLNGGAITSEGLKQLAPLKNLESIALSATLVDDKIFNFINQWPKLKEITIANTKIDSKSIANLKSKYPKLRIIIDQPTEERLPLTNPKLKNESTVLDANDYVEFIPNIRGSITKYTIDGTQPDSLHGIEYKSKIKVDNLTRVRAITTKEGWITSQEFDQLFYLKGIKVDSCDMLNKPDAKYPGIGSYGLIDFELSSIYNRGNNNWMGFRDVPFKSIFHFKEAKAINKIIVSYGIMVGSYIFPPTQARVYGSNDNANFTPLQKSSITPLSKGQDNLTKAENISLTINTKEKYKYYKVEVDNLAKIPTWHNGKGEKGWLFIDEVFFY